MITIAHKQSRDGTKTYANLIGISPVIDQLKAQVLPLESFLISQTPPPAPAGVSTLPSAAGATPQLTDPQAPYNQQPQPAGFAPQSAPPATPATAPEWNPHTTTNEEVPF